MGQGQNSILIRRDSNELENIRTGIFVNTPGMSEFHTITGAHEIGKSTQRDMWYSLWAEETAKNGGKDVYFVSVSVANLNTALDIWKAVVWGLSDQIEDNYPRMTEAIRKIDEAEEKIKATTLQTLVVNMFKLCKTLGIHVILILDEVQKVNKWGNEEKKNFLYTLLNIHSEKATCGVSVLLLTQKLIRDMVSDTDSELSALILRYPEVRLSGFNYIDLPKIFMKMKEHGQNLSRATIGRLLYYCGRHPGLISLVSEAKFEDSVSGVDLCCKNSRTRFNEIYKWFADELKEVKFLSADGEINGTNVFMQAFVGPCFETEFEISEWLETLYDKCLIEKSAMKYVYRARESRGESCSGEQLCHIYDHIAGLMEGDESEQTYKDFYADSFAKKMYYEPVSPYFIEYLVNQIRKDEDDEIRELRVLIRRTEILLRKLIYDVYEKEALVALGFASAETDRQKKSLWDKICDNLIYSISHNNAGNIRNNTKVTYWQGSDGVKLKAERLKRYEITPVDVLAFNNYYQLITWKDHRTGNDDRKCWTELSGYLSCYRQANNPARYNDSEMRADFEFLNDSRNYFAHENVAVGFAEEENRAKLKGICNKIIESIENEEARLNGGTT